MGCLTRSLHPAPCTFLRDRTLFDIFHWFAEPSQGDSVISECTDDSFMDGKWGRDIAVLGQAFVTFDAKSKIVAAAYGAVQGVFASISLPAKMYIDCKTVQVAVNVFGPARPREGMREFGLRFISALTTGKRQVGLSGCQRILRAAELARSGVGTPQLLMRTCWLLISSLIYLHSRGPSSWRICAGHDQRVGQ